MGALVSLGPALKEVKSIELDAMIFIYYAEAHRQFGPFAREIFAAIEQGTITAYTSMITITEVLTGYRLAKNQRGEDIFKNMFRVLDPSLLLVPVTVEVADRSASLRALYGLRTPDALHIASALSVGAEAYITNDRKLKVVKEIPVWVIADFVKARSA